MTSTSAIETTQPNTPAPGPSSPAAPLASMTLEDAHRRIDELEHAIGMARAAQPFNEGGALGRLGNWLLGASWRTTVASAGVLAGTVAVVVCQSAPDLLPFGLARYAPVIPLIAVAAGLRVAKDVQTSGVARPKQ